MITGAMAMPWMFSCRRFVSPTFLQHLRGPQGSRVAQPLEAGKYIGIYWINEGRLEDHEQWALGSNYRLHAEGRGSYRGAGHDPIEERRHVFTSFSDYLGPVYRDDAVPRDMHTLVQPYQGLVVQVVDATNDRAELDAWLTSTYLPSVVRGRNAVATRFAPRPLPGDKLAHVRGLDGAYARAAASSSSQRVSFTRGRPCSVPRASSTASTRSCRCCTFSRPIHASAGTSSSPMPRTASRRVASPRSGCRPRSSPRTTARTTTPTNCSEPRHLMERPNA